MSSSFAEGFATLAGLQQLLRLVTFSLGLTKQLLPLDAESIVAGTSSASMSLDAVKLPRVSSSSLISQSISTSFPSSVQLFKVLMACVVILQYIPTAVPLLKKMARVSNRFYYLFFQDFFSSPSPPSPPPKKSQTKTSVSFLQKGKASKIETEHHGRAPKHVRVSC
jgi:hypothetical protein